MPSRPRSTAGSMRQLRPAAVVFIVTVVLAGTAALLVSAPARIDRPALFCALLVLSILASALEVRLPLRSSHADEDRHVRELSEMNAATRAALDRAVASERALAAEKDRLAVTLRSIGDAVISTDAGGRVVLMNAVAEGLSGLSQAQAAGEPLSAVMSLIDPQTGAPDAALSAEVLPEGAERALLASPAGNVSTLERRVSPIFDSAGVPCGAVWVFRDVTGAVQLQEERLKASKLESLGVLAGGIAHDFNNILTAIAGNVSLAREDAPGPVQEVLAEAERACTRARALTNRLLTFSKGGAPMKVTASIATMIPESAAAALRGSSIRSSCAIAPDLWDVRGDVDQLSQALQNLVINARQAMREGRAVTIEASNVEAGSGVSALRPGRYVRIEVVDEGCGIPEAILPKIFDPYFTTKTGSAGLGLATAYSIVKAHGGHLAVESTSGAGSRFSMYVPAATAAVDRPAAPAPTRRGARLLLMDDEEAIRIVARRMLERAGYEVETVIDGVQAIEAFARAARSGRPFDIVMMDLTVPGAMGGVEAVRHLRVTAPALKAIVSSGYADNDVISEFERYGFCAVVAKPFVATELCAVLDRVLAEPSPSEGSRRRTVPTAAAS